MSSLQEVGLRLLYLSFLDRGGFPKDNEEQRPRYA
jgi:hypothetical protein